MRSIYVRLLVGACLTIASLRAHAAELSAPRLLADLVPGVATVPFQWEPYPLAAAGAHTLFTAYLADGGAELLSSDGTLQGTERILPPAGYVDFAWEQGDEAGVLVEQADGAALLRTDGTAAGTVSVASWPGAVMIGWYGRGDGTTWVAPCYDPGADEPDRCELWKVDDGAPAAEKLADDLPLDNQCCSDMEQPSVDGRLLFFTVGDGDTTLWRSDGTAATTVPLKQLPPGSFVYWLGRSGRRVVFAVDRAGAGSQVWTSDGTAEGTREMVQLATDPWAAGWDWYYRKQGPFFFTAGEPATRTTGLWAVGPAGKAKRLGSFAQIDGDVHAIGAGPTTRYLFAAARHPAAPGDPARLRLWITDGTPAGTMELRGIPGGPLLVEHVWGIAAGHFYFTANDGTTGVEPWTTDGTAAGTRRLADTCPGPCGSRLNGVASIGAAALFIADSGGEQMLWRSDGTSASPVVPITGGTAVFSDVGDPFAPVAGGHAFFTVGAGNAFALWATDGSAAGTGPVAPGATAALGSDPAPLAVSAQSLLFTAVDPLDPERRRLYFQRRDEALSAGVRLPEYVRPTSGVIDDGRGLALFVAYQLWTTDGTAAGTVQLTAFGALRSSASDALAGDKYHDDCDDRIDLPQRIGDHWWFAADLCSGGGQLWSTDGTLAGTRRSTLLPEDVFSPVLLGEAVFYFATVASGDGAEEPQLFRRALAGGEPVQLTHRAGGLPQFGLRLAGAGPGRLFFTIANDDGYELWVSDGTAAGTGTVTAAPDGLPLANVRSVALGAGSALVWTGTDEFTDSTLFAISPDSRIATRLGDVRVQSSSFETIEWASSRTGVFFAGWDPQHGAEPWISDGTPAGTHVLDLLPGAASSAPHAFAASDAGVFFAARDQDNGEELWIDDGAGGRLVADLAPGRFSSSPSSLVAGPGGLLFAADDGDSGSEPWFLEWTPSNSSPAADGGAR